MYNIYLYTLHLLLIGTGQTYRFIHNCILDNMKIEYMLQKDNGFYIYNNI